MVLESYIEGEWQKGSGGATPLYHAVNGNEIAQISSTGIDFKGMLEYGRNVGGPSLRALTFHERARRIKALAKYLMDRKEEFYKLSAATGATKRDSWIDIEGGIGTLFSYSSKARRELPDESFYVDGALEPLSKEGTFVGQHLCVPLQGIALHINAFNFPCWGMLEKIAPTLLAGVPAIVKPASLTAYLTELMVRRIVESKLLPEGALQLICGSVGDTFEHLTCQDIVTFTGSAQTGIKLKSHPNILTNSIRFNMEADSLNCSILGPDATPGKEEFDLFIREVANEITVKAGQKCTAIRRIIVPEKLVSDVREALSERLRKVPVGDPTNEAVRMGPLAGKPQVEEVLSRVTQLAKECELIYGSVDNFDLIGATKEKGAFCPPLLLYCDKPFSKMAVHETEAFGPVSTIIPYEKFTDAIELSKLGKGSLV
ncbi:MAG: phenylacetic acid degradation bifunctional protein PaaZ, partial [Bdellovibrionales bacterium]|nr:phenylacetic acid degradation bifunctional protein PaaZ [Bdellovibrionales bacterium]